MNSLQLALFFIPEWALPWIAVIGAAAWILEIRSIAFMAGVVLFIEFILAPILAPIIMILPNWALFLLSATVVLSLLSGAITFLFGKEAAGHVVGTYIVRVIDLSLFGPFRLIRRIIQVFIFRI